MRKVPSPAYRGNPLNEALPWDLEKPQFERFVQILPAFDPADRKRPASERIQLVRRAARLFIPLPRHWHLGEVFQDMLRSGYLARNPAVPGYYRFSRRKVMRILTKLGIDIDPKYFPEAQDGAMEFLMTAPNEVLPSAGGFHFMGLSGMGKSTTLARILSRYPQVLFHDFYKGQPCTFDQVVWLTLECPSNGTSKSLCEKFFEALDKLLPTSYLARAQKDMTIEEMLMLMANLALLHGLGVLVVDEIQRLSEIKSGGRSQMLNFFTELVNTIGLPVVLVGTPKANAVLTSEFRQTRRGCGPGDSIWPRLNEDDQWHQFVRALSMYQYTRKKVHVDKLGSTQADGVIRVPLEPADWVKQLYYQTQGIIDLAVKLFMLSQVRAIHKGLEQLTSKLIESVAADRFSSAQGALDAIRSGNTEKMEQYGDLYIDMDAAVNDELGAVA